MDMETHSNSNAQNDNDDNYDEKEEYNLLRKKFWKKIEEGAQRRRNEREKLKLIAQAE